MARERRIADSLESYPDDWALVQAVLEEPDDLVIWPTTGLAEAGLTAGQRAVVSTWRLDCEVRNGGFGQYFAVLGAEARVAAGETLLGLERLGAVEHQALLAQALTRFESGSPADPAARRARPPAGHLETEEQVAEALRHAAIGVMGPDLDALRRRAAERKRWLADLRETFGELDDRYLALWRDGAPLERYWASYVRAHPREFFTR